MTDTNHEHTKEALRAEYLRKRKVLGEEELATLNSGLQEQLRRLKLSGVSGHSIKTGHTFLPIASMAEPDTRSLAAIIDGIAGKPLRWAISKTERKTTGMYHFVWDKDTLIRENKWGIPEPLGGYRISEAEIDLILVPLLAFDFRGHRVGYGKGYYDRFLGRCRPDALKIGVSLFDPVPAIAGIHEADVGLDACLSPNELYWFGKD